MRRVFLLSCFCVLVSDDEVWYDTFCFNMCIYIYCVHFDMFCIALLSVGIVDCSYVVGVCGWYVFVDVQYVVWRCFVSCVA